MFAASPTEIEPPLLHSYHLIYSPYSRPGKCSDPFPCVKALALMRLCKCSRELSHEWLHEERVLRSNVHLHSHRIELGCNNGSDRRNDDAF